MTTCLKPLNGPLSAISVEAPFADASSSSNGGSMARCRVASSRCIASGSCHAAGSGDACGGDGWCGSSGEASSGAGQPQCAITEPAASLHEQHMFRLQAEQQLVLGSQLCKVAFITMAALICHAFDDI